MSEIRHTPTLNVSQTVLIKRQCDKCEEGFYQLSDRNIELLSKPPQYPHHCASCGDRRNFTKKYPYTEVEYVPLTTELLAEFLAERVPYRGGE